MPVFERKLLQAGLEHGQLHFHVLELRLVHLVTERLVLTLQRTHIRDVRLGSMQ